MTGLHQDSRGLPPAFCWTKYGTEAGEPISGILARKEQERVANDGVFLWGIGTSIRPSLEALLQQNVEPQVLFTPMLTAPAKQDVYPEGVVHWQSAIGLDGATYEIPKGSRVTSRRSARRNHFALVCQSEHQIVPAETSSGWLCETGVRNLLTGRPVGSSQVTSVVETSATPATPRYRVTLRARLVAPYFLVLGDPTSV
jgi:hypothetical protein